MFEFSLPKKPIWHLTSKIHHQCMAKFLMRVRRERTNIILSRHEQARTGSWFLFGCSALCPILLALGRCKFIFHNAHIGVLRSFGEKSTPRHTHLLKLLRLLLLVDYPHHCHCQIHRCASSPGSLHQIGRDSLWKVKKNNCWLPTAWIRAVGSRKKLI